MKKVIAFCLAIVVLLISVGSIAMAFKQHGVLEWIGVAGSLLSSLPALDYWFNYFKKRLE